MSSFIYITNSFGIECQLFYLIKKIYLIKLENLMKLAIPFGNIELTNNIKHHIILPR
jgi:hypothetical protein